MSYFSFFQFYVSANGVVCGVDSTQNATQSATWCKQRSLFAKWAIQNNSDVLAAAHIMRKN